MRIPLGLRDRRTALALALALGASALALALVCRPLFADLPPPSALTARAAPAATRITDRQGQLLAEVVDPRQGRRTRVRLAELPPHVTNAVLAVEDAGFRSHPGVDVRGVARAVVQGLLAREAQSGASTITQQLARDVLMSPAERQQRTLLRKAREMLLALRLERAYDKDTLLETYLNEVYFGQLAYGMNAAAQTYFGVPARDLDLAQAALLAGLIQAPAAYNPLVVPQAARARQRDVLALMVKDGMLSPDEAQMAADETLEFTGGGPAFRAPHFTVYVRNLLEQRYGADLVNGGGLQVTTTLALDVQEMAEATARRYVAQLGEARPNEPDHHVGGAAVVALDPPTGQILALVGSPDYWQARDGAVNVALAQRQPGSAIKIVTYAAAFGRDLTPATVIADVPTSFQTQEREPYLPRNYDGVWHGPLTLRRALATSSNMVAVKVLDHIGLDAFRETARALGLNSFDEHQGLALTLGAGEVRLLDLTAAYATFAAEGVYRAPVGILEVRDAEGRSLERWEPTAGVQAVSPQVAYLITDILADDSARIPAFGEESVLHLSRPAAAKTGTTTDFRDNWTLGYTPDLAVGVWVGNPDGTPMVRTSGITGAGPIWHDVMEAAHNGVPIRDFPQPPGLVAAQICETSGLLATALCQRQRSEVFIAGTEPRETDDSYVALAVDEPTGLLAAPGCTGPTVERVFRRVPPEAQDWAIAEDVAVPPTRSCAEAEAAPGPPALPAHPTMWNKNASPDVEISSALLSLVTPAANAEYAVTGELPAASQRIEIRARLASPATGREHVTLLVDGAPLATLDAPPYRALWQIGPGEHVAQAVAVDDTGRPIASAQSHFTVRADVPWPH
ncbi:MAG: transglycosylase domain-containing protein [Anaerolineae bacterium]